MNTNGSSNGPGTAQSGAQPGATFGSRHSARTQQQNSPAPAWLKGEAVADLPDDPPKTVIDGLLRIGEKLGITAGSKRYKSWAIAYIAFCLANGFPVFGLKTVKSRVSLIDLELKRHSIKRRLLHIQRRLGKGDCKNITVYALRGRAKEFRHRTREGEKSNLDHLIDALRSDQTDVTIVDPVYKFLVGKSEIDTEFVSDMLETLTEFCEQTNAALIYVHHHSKGNQSAKEVLDRGSGSGVFGRDADALVDLVEHAASTPAERIFTVEFALRDQPEIEKFVVHWSFPIFERDTTGLDPDELKAPPRSRGAKQKAKTADRVLDLLYCAEHFAGLPGLTAKQMAEAIGSTLRTVQIACQKMAPAKVVRSVSIDGWQLKP
jgi:hypothetical protein